jgi:hypothetical protein
MQTCANSTPDSGAISEGFSTMVQPATSAGATLQAIWFIGQFQGVISAQTPIPSWTMRVVPRMYSQTISFAALMVAFDMHLPRPGLRAARPFDGGAHLGRHHLGEVLVSRSL